MSEPTTVLDGLLEKLALATATGDSELTIDTAEVLTALDELSRETEEVVGSLLGNLSLVFSLVGLLSDDATEATESE